MSPRLTGAAGATFNRSGWEASVAIRYSDSYFSDIENNPRGDVAPYWVTNIMAGKSIGHFRLYGRVDNLFDSNKALAIYSGETPEDDGASILRPRTYWLGLQWRL